MPIFKPWYIWVIVFSPLFPPILLLILADMLGTIAKRLELATEAVRLEAEQ